MSRGWRESRQPNASTAINLLENKGECHTGNPFYLESSDTVSSSDGDLPPFFLRSDKIIPHAFVHFPDQVRMGGTHRFHDTSLAESSHVDYLQVAGQRARSYHDLNRSAEGMMKFNNEIQLLEETCRQAGIGEGAG
jgi:hypothetical protein